MEASFYGCEGAKLSGSHFTCAQYMQIGRELCRSLICCFDLKSDIQILNDPFESSLLKGKGAFDSLYSKKIL